MDKDKASAILLALRGSMLLTLALADWLAAKANASDRSYLVPSRVACEFRAGIDAAWHGRNRLPSLSACKHWSRNSCGPSPGDSARPF